MREQLIQYVELLFAGARDCEDVKQEILQNTLDRFDDLVAEGKVPEAAYRLAISGIGDINEILGTNSSAMPVSPSSGARFDNDDSKTKKWMRAAAAGLYILCPLPLIMLSTFGMDILGVCGLLGTVAMATVLLILGEKKERKEETIREEHSKTPLQKSISGFLWSAGTALYVLISFATDAWHITWVIFLILPALDKFVNLVPSGNDGEPITAPARNRKQQEYIRSAIWAIALVIYFSVSFTTSAWYITWLIFPIAGAVQELVEAILDLKEVMDYET